MRDRPDQLDDRPPATPLVTAVYALYGLSVALIPFVKVGAIRRLGPAIQVSDLVFAAAAGLWLIALLRGQLRLRLRRAHLAVAALVLAALLSFTATPSLRTSIVKLVGWGFLIALMVVTTSLAETRVGWRRVVASWLVGAAATAAIGLLSAALFYAGVRDPRTNIWLWNYGSVPVGSYPRLAIWFENANMLCSYLLVSLALVPAAWPHADARWRRALVALAAAMTVVALFTLSTGFGGLMLGGAVGWILWRRHTGRVRLAREAIVGLAGTGAALAFLAITVILLVPRGEGDIPLGPVDVQLARSGRVSNWEAALDTWRAHPITGAGLGVLVAQVSNPRALYPMEYWGTERMKEHPSAKRPMEGHNIFLNVLGQVGLLGGLALAALIALLMVGLLPAPGEAAETALPRVALFAAMIGAVLYHGQFAGIEESRQYWFLFGLILALEGGAQGSPAASRGTLHANG